MIGVKKLFKKSVTLDKFKFHLTVN